MTIEQRINRLLASVDNPTPFWQSIDDIIWNGCPISMREDLGANLVRLAYSPEFVINLDSLIKKADKAECLTSKIEYIRKCKKWFLNEEKK